MIALIVLLRFDTVLISLKGVVLQVSVIVYGCHATFCKIMILEYSIA